MSTSTHLTLKSQTRVLLGNTGKKLRRQGLIPAVVYGHGIPTPINIALPYNDFEKVYRTSGSTSVVDVDVDGKKLHTLVHALQFHPVKDTFIHIDFLAVNLKKAIETEVPLSFVGVPAPVKQDGAVLNKSMEYVTISALPDSIPHEIEVDLSVMETINDVIQVKDLKVVKGVEIISELNDVIASLSFAQEEPETTETPETQIGTAPTDEKTTQE